MKKYLLNGKLMEMKLKAGWTSTDFANYLDCSEDEFLEAIKITFNSTPAKKMLNRLEQNKKRFNKGLRSTKGCKRVKEAKYDKKVKEKELSTDEIIKMLSNKEVKVKQKIVDDKKMKSSIFSRKSKLENELIEEEKTLSDLKLRLENSNKRMTNLASEIKKTDLEIKKIEEKISDGYELIEKIQEEISEYRKITIFVYESGEVEIEGIKEFDVPENWVEIFQNISCKDFVEDLPIKQVKILANIVAFVLTLDVKFEVTFELEKLQRVFEKILK